jgi:hypothetical protein
VTVRPALARSSSRIVLAPNALNACSSTRSTRSPGASPAAAAGDPGSTYGTVTPIAGSPVRVMPVKITKASRKFIATPATRIRALTPMPWAANERGSSASPPSSPSILTKPPMGSQLRLRTVPPLSCSTLARGGNPIPNSRTRTPASRATTK